MADNNEDEQGFSTEPAVEVTPQESNPVVDNSVAKQPSAPAPVNNFGIVSPVATTTLQERIDAGDNILLENTEDADSLKDGSVIVYAVQDAGMSIGIGNALVPYAPYVVGDDLPLELAQRLVANRICAVQGSHLDPYAGK